MNKIAIAQGGGGQNRKVIYFFLLITSKLYKTKSVSTFRRIHQNIQSSYVFSMKYILFYKKLKSLIP